MTATALQALIDSIPALETAAAEAARARLERLTKPPGSLGALEDLAVRLAAITGRVKPPVAQPAVLIAAADHGVVAEGVSPYPQAVTAQMVSNFLAGGAAINVLAGVVGARVVVVNAGVAAELPNHPRLVHAATARGTRNLLREPAMARDVALQTMLRGAAIVAAEAEAGMDLLALGEMGIGNSTSAACLTSAYTGAPPEQTTGRGTGVDDAGLRHKRGVVAAALARAHPERLDPLAILAELGGLEIALLAGAALAAAARRIPVLLDGYIATSAALAAAAIAPPVRGFLIAGHRSAEPGHRLALAHLELRPLLELDMRLGEGSGAALAIPLVQAAARVMSDMATFETAGVSDRA
jgi:nicotinate-nucleotide--dimethylbenzimidazole phosphoribosyltransferase